MSLVSTRLPPEMKEEIEEYAEKEHVGKTVALRKLLERGLKEVRIEHALEEYGMGKVTLWKAAETAKLPLWEMMELAKKKGVSAPYTLRDVEEDLKAAFEG
ncbi:ribbon-helix-helix protein, copG family [archaeon BMS3Abin16]|nr:ribbon-helix-helix protein, copG family [archaeon BMS3Abin16]